MNVLREGYRTFRKEGVPGGQRGRKSRPSQMKRPLGEGQNPLYERSSRTNVFSYALEEKKKKKAFQKRRVGRCALEEDAQQLSDMVRTLALVSANGYNGEKGKVGQGV